MLKEGDMKFKTLNTPDKRLSPVVPAKASCGCSVQEIPLSDDTALTPQYIIGYISMNSWKVPQVSTMLSSRDKWETVKARASSFRMKFSVKPGLYAAGSPDENSDVFVTANYKMSFDGLRSALDGINAWILVLDTDGINVWCAAGKGTFGTNELLKRISLAKLPELVVNKRLIVPQLGAPGIDSGEVRRKSGFRVMYGPVRAEDLVNYIRNGYKCDEEMRSVRFDMIDRLILTPIELRQISGKFPLFVLSVFIFFGLTPEGIIFNDSVINGYPFLIGGILAIFAGAFFTPVLLPFIPFRSFAIKGWISGMVLSGAVVYFTGVFKTFNIFLIVSAMILFPLLSSYMALQFTGASTFTSLSGVKKELGIALPVYIFGAVLSFLFLILYKISDWGLL